MHECTCNPGYMRDELIPQVGIITDIRTETPDVKTFRVNAPGGGKLFEHMPGQCAMVCVPGVGEAMFSITSSPTNKEFQEFSIKRCGVLTEHLHSLKAGDEILVRGPYGNNFPVETELKGKNLLFIAGGIAYQYVKEACPEASVLKLGLVHPLPRKLIEEFAKKVETLYIFEELEPVFEEQIKSWGIKCIGKEIFTVQGEYSANMIRKAILNEEVKIDTPYEVPTRPPILCPGCPHRSVFSVLNKLKIHAAGDIGCYTLGAALPLQSVDTTICMGASVSAAHGMAKAQGKEFNKKLVSVIGDSTFMHSGITGLIDIVYNKGNNTVLILDNSITGMTGHQENPTTGYTIRGEETKQVNLIALCKACGIDNVVVCDPFDVKEFEKVVKTEVEREEPSVIIAQRPCALLKSVKYTGRCKIGDNCKNCKMCMKLGCPAITLKDDKVVIDKTQCNGCGLCINVCPFNAIEKEEN